MKKVFIIAALLAMLSVAFSQQYLFENFEAAFQGTPGAPPGWTQTMNRPVQHATTEKDWLRNTWSGTAWTLSSSGTNPAGAYSGTGVLWIDDYNYNTSSIPQNSRRMESPVVNLSGSTSPYIRFWYFNNQGVGVTMNLRVMVSANSGATWDLLTPIVNGFTVTNATWNQISLSIPAAYRTSGFKLGIELTNRYGTNNPFIDDISVEEFTPITIVSAQTGDWNLATTWVGGAVPTANNHVEIADGHTVTVTNTTSTTGIIARCQNLTVNGTLNHGAGTSNLLHAFGDIAVNGTFNAFNGTSGRAVYCGGSFGIGSSGTVNFSIGTTAQSTGTTTISTGASGLIFFNNQPATFNNEGTLTSGRIGNILHMGQGSFTYDRQITVNYMFGLYLGNVNPNSNLTLGDRPASGVFAFERSNGTFTSNPLWNNTNVTSRNYVYYSPNWVPLTQTTITTGNEIEVVSTVRTITGTLTMNTHNHLQLAYPLNVGTTTTGGLALTRGIIISDETNVLHLAQGNTSTALGTLPSTATPPNNHGSYIVGVVRRTFPDTGTATRQFPLGVGTQFNGAVPNANVRKHVTIASGTNGCAAQSPSVSIVGPPSGTANAPLTTSIGARAFRVNRNGGPDFTADATIALRGNNYLYGDALNSDNLMGNTDQLTIAQSTALTGTWTERSVRSGASTPIANNTDQERTTVATNAPGPIAPLATYGEYFAWATTVSLDPPGQASPIYPTLEQTQINPKTLVLQWNPPTSGGLVEGYTLYIGTNFEELFSDYVYEINLGPTALQYNLFANGILLDFNTRWFWVAVPFNQYGGQPAVIDIWVFRTSPQIFSSATLALGSVWPGTQSNGTILVENLGNTMASFTVTGPAEFEFAPARYTIPANSVYNLPYTFTAPATTGAYQGQITLTATSGTGGSITINAQGNISTELEVGTGTANLFQPVYPYYGYTYSQTIYPAAWLSYPDGYRIERLQFYWNPALAPLNTTDFKVWMGHTTQSQFPSTVTSASWIPLNQLTQVFDGTWEITAGAGWKELILQTPFIYNRTDNLVIAMDENTPGYDTSGNSTNSFFRGTNTTGVYHGMSCYADSYNFDPANPDATPPSSYTSYASRQGYPNTRFIVAPVPTAPQIVVTPETWDFGTVVINTTDTKQFSIANNGAGTLTISGITPASEGFFTLTNLPTFPVNLTSGQSTTFTVQYLPTAAGTHTATFNINDNRAITPVVVEGVCVDPRIVTLPHAQNFDGVVAPALPLGWTAYRGNTLQTLNNSTTSPHTPPNNVYFWNSTYTTVPLRLITPQVTIPINTVKASFWARSGTAGTLLKIGTVNALDGSGVFTELGSISLTTTMTIYSVSLAAAGADQYICFQHDNSVASRSIYLDTVLLEELVPSDLAATLLTGPSMGSVGSSIAYNLTVYNNGTQTQNNYTVKLMSMDARTELASLTINTPLAPAQTAVHTLNWTPATVGSVSIYGKVVLAGDQNASNDNTSVRSVTIFPAGNTPIPVGNQESTLTTNLVPLSFSFNNSVSETIYFEDELQLLSGSITAVIYKNNFTQELLGKPVKIWMGSSELANLSGGWIPAENYTLVFNGLVDFPLGVNDVVIPLQTPYAYSGGNLIVRANRPMDTAVFATTNNFVYTNTTQYPNRSRYVRSTTVEYDPLAPSAAGTLSGFVPNSTFIVQNASAIQPVTVSGSVTASDAPAGLEGAQVRLTGYATHTVMTGAGGSFSIPNVWGSVSGRTYTLTASKAGYGTYQTQVTIVNSNVVVPPINLIEIAYPVYNVVAEEAITRAVQVNLTWDPAGPPPYYFTDFETDNGGWIASSNWTGTALPNYPDGDWQWTNTYNVANYNTTGGSSPQNPPTTAYSGTGMWGTVIYGPFTNLTVSGQRSFLRQSFDLSVFTNPVISLWHHMDGSNTWDYGQIMVNGTAVWGTSALAVFMPWQQITVDLSAYASLTNAVISFEWSSTTVSNYAGWYIDDIYVGPATGRTAASFGGDRSFTSYSVYRLNPADEGNPANWVSVANGLQNENYSDLGWNAVTPGDYKWAVVANYTAGLTSNPTFSNLLTRTPDTMDPVANLSVALVGTNVVLAWDAVTGAIAYKIYASDDPYGLTWTYMDLATNPTYTIIAPAADYKFYYVTAVGGEMPDPPRTGILPSKSK